MFRNRSLKDPSGLFWGSEGEGETAVASTTHALTGKCPSDSARRCPVLDEFNGDCGCQPWRALRTGAQLYRHL